VKKGNQKANRLFGTGPLSENSSTSSLSDTKRKETTLIKSHEIASEEKTFREPTKCEENTIEISRSKSTDSKSYYGSQENRLDDDTNCCY